MIGERTPRARPGILRAMQVRIFQLDSFTDRLFAGNPAAVCPLPRWIEDATLQAIARENNLSETAFVVRRDDGDYELRWFTPTLEVDLCGHATLASAAVVLDDLEPGKETVTFHTRSGALVVRRAGAALRMDFPALPATPCEPPEGLAEALGAWPRSVLRSRAVLMCVFDAPSDVAALAPDFARVRALDVESIIATARGDATCDFVSRFFAPAHGIDEDPVTGSAHCSLAPYWGARLKKTRMAAKQISARGGELECELAGDRVFLEGRVARYLSGTIALP
jgi:predicted PhzF superfamily epimerase YddE/YHI9